MGDFTCYAIGLFYASVCTTMKNAEAVEERMNEAHPTGIDSRWRVADEAFRTGEPNPCPCSDHPETHRHWLLSC